MRGRASESEFPISLRGAFVRDLQEPKSYDALAAELQAALAREATCLQEKNELSRRQAMLAEEFEHRLVNGLQLIVSLLSLQSRSAPTPEAAHQLTIAARRVSAIGRVHHRLHLLDHQDTSGVQAIPSASVRGPFRPAVPGCEVATPLWSRAPNAEIPTRLGDSAGLYRQRADHKLRRSMPRATSPFGSTRYRRPIVRCRSSMTGRDCLPGSRHRTAKGWE